MYDVGGQRNERRKWVNCFENVRAPASLDAGVGDAPPLLGDERALRRVAQRLRREDVRGRAAISRAPPVERPTRGVAQVRGRDDEPHEGRARPLRGGLRQPPLLERVDAALPQQARPLRGQGRGGPHRASMATPRAPPTRGPRAARPTASRTTPAKRTTTPTASATSRTSSCGRTRTRSGRSSATSRARRTRPTRVSAASSGGSRAGSRARPQVRAVMDMCYHVITQKKLESIGFM